MSREDSISTIQRCPHDDSNPYVMVNNNLIRDNSISPECRWLLIYLLANEDGWKIRTSQLVTHLKGHKGYGRDRILEILKEAIWAGYMKRESFLEKNMTRYRYFLSENRKFSNNFTDALNPRAPGARAPEFRALKNNQSSSYEEDKEGKKGEREAALPAPTFSFSKSGRVKLESSKLTQLYEEFGESKIKEMIDRLDEYSYINPKRFKQYGCHATVIRKWIRDDITKEKDQPKSKINSNKEWMDKIKIRFNSRNDIYYSDSAITFASGASQLTIKVDDSGFREQVMSRLLKMGLSVDGL